MKNALRIIPILLAIASPFSVFAATSVSPSTYTHGSDSFTVSSSFGTDAPLIFFSQRGDGSLGETGAPFSSSISGFASGFGGTAPFPPYWAIGDSILVADAPDLGTYFGCLPATDAATMAACTGGTVSTVSYSPPFSGGFSNIISATTTMAAVVQSVQTTGTLIWPLFVFVGILIAFYIAMKVGDFVRGSISDRNARKQKDIEYEHARFKKAIETDGASYEEEFTAEQRGRIVNKIKELGDRDSFDE